MFARLPSVLPARLVIVPLDRSVLAVFGHEHRGCRGRRDEPFPAGAERLPVPPADVRGGILARNAVLPPCMAHLRGKLRCTCMAIALARVAVRAIASPAGLHAALCKRIGV